MRRVGPLAFFSMALPVTCNCACGREGYDPVNAHCFVLTSLRIKRDEICVHDGDQHCAGLDFRLHNIITIQAFKVHCIRTLALECWQDPCKGLAGRHGHKGAHGSTGPRRAICTRAPTTKPQQVKGRGHFQPCQGAAQRASPNKHKMV